MNKLYFILAFCFLFNSRSDAQLAQMEGLSHVADSYFRSNPFKSQFSTFVEHLMSDPGIARKEKRLRSDSALFYFYGVYTKYNPFFFKPRRVEVLLEEVPFQYNDSLPPKDTLMVYQLIAYGQPGEQGLKEIKKEFEKLHRRYKGQFFETNYKEYKENDTVTGASHNYFTGVVVLAPLSIAWGNMESTGEPVLNITLRFKTIVNRAILPAVSYRP